MKETKGKKQALGTKFSFLSSLIAFLLNISPTTLAQTPKLGVVRSQENESHWAGIVSRLQLSQVNYCVIEQSNLKDIERSNISVLLLPNIETLDGLQVSSVSRWLEGGGGIIATGPVGSFSNPQVKNQLRSILGAYWGFALSSPATLEVTPVKQQAWARYANQNNTFMGGVIIPSGLNSKTVATWNADGSPPAVVATPQSTFFGWRWGVDNVTSPQFDATWLQAALTRYGNLAGSANPSDVCVIDDFQPSTNLLSTTNTPQQPSISQPKPVETPQNQPVTSRETKPVETPRNQPVTSRETKPVETPQNQPVTSRETKPVETPRNQPVTPTSEAVSLTSNTEVSIETNVEPNAEGWRLIVDPEPPKPTPQRVNNGRIPPYQFRGMGTELENLIGRVETVVLASDAYHNSANVSTINKGINNPQGNNSQAKQAIAQAQQGLENFNRFVAAGDYEQARREWEMATRILWENYPHDRQAYNSEIRAIWLDRGTLVKIKSEAEFAKLFDQFAAAGINTVFLETLNASYPVYPSKIAPEQNPQLQDWDRLKVGIKLAHERNMELHAWVWVFAAANQRHNSILRQPADYLGPVLTRHPDWANFDQQGNIFHPKTRKAFFDPANDQVRAYLLSLFEEIVTNYDVDGIQLDYIRYPFQDPWGGYMSGYGQAGRQKFMAMTGVDPLTLPLHDPLWAEWTRFRVDQIDSFVATVSQQLKAKKPDLIISAAVFPMSQGERVNKIQQNWEEWIKDDLVDLLVPMTYATDSTQLQRLAQPLLNRNLEGSALFLPGIRLLNMPDLVTFDQVQLLRGLPTAGYALFAAENLNPNLQKIFNLNQGEVVADVLPTRDPFLAALSRYRNLQQEWNFLLANQQLLIDESVRSEWTKKMHDLETNLKNLAENPSNRNFLYAELALKSFRTQFPEWMANHEVQKPYQVQAWENRLLSLEQLLEYGERVKLK